MSPLSPRDGRLRVAVVGGGISGLTAAYELSRTPELRRRYQVTVYQMGFRLGGKLASGRNLAAACRNEEHGLHVWFGFYENTFRLGREVYERWRRPDDCPFASVWDIVRPQNHGLLGFPHDGRYHVAPVHFPRSCDVPGDERALPSPLGLVGGVLDAARALAAVLALETGRVPRRSLTRHLWPDGRPSSSQLRWLWSAPEEVDRDLVARYQARLASLTQRFADRLRQVGADERAELAARAHRMLERAHRPIHRALDWLTKDAPSYRALHYFVDTSLAFFRGLTNPNDGIYVDGDLDRVNDRDFRTWLVDNGCAAETAERSPWIEALYDSSFQYLGGRRDEPSFEAGTAARYVIRGYLAYKHCPAYLVEAGMGEAFVAPLYEVLVEQGVLFSFFHRLEDVDLSPDGRRIERLRFARQARVTRGDYRPLFTHRGLRCWPTTPDYDQLEDGTALREAGIDFESRWSPTDHEDERTLEIDRDFDAVVSGLPLGSLARDADGHRACRSWVEAVPHIQQAADTINLMPSIATQLWFDRDMRRLGWDLRTSVVGWAQPLSIWCDMTPVIAHEGWPSEAAPQSCVYLCGVAAAEAPLASSTDPDARRRAHRAALSAITEQLERHGADMWPGASTPSGAFDWQVLHDPEGRRGPERLLAQYVRVNAEPWDLTAGAAVGQSRYRPEAHQSGLDNLALAGTWTRTSVGTSSIEAGIMSGIAAARALGVEGREIIGEDFMCRPPAAERLPIFTLAPAARVA